MFLELLPVVVRMLLNITVCTLPLSASCSCTPQVHALGLLRFILINLSHNGMMVNIVDV
jgi:hypothetical protein